MPEWLIPLLTFFAGIAGGYAGARGAIIKLEVQMEDVRKRQETAAKRLHAHNNDILVHDMEIESALQKLQLPRMRRQRMPE